MKHADEEWLYQTMDRLKLRHVSRATGDLDSSEDETYGTADLERMKAAVFQKLALPRDERHITVPQEPVRHPKNRKKRALIVAASFVVAVAACVSVSAVVSPEVRAQLKKIVSFVPGFSWKDRTEGQAYVLPMPVKAKTDSGEIEIRGVYVDDKYAIVEITSEHDLPIEKVELINDQGDRFTLGSGRRSQSTGMWLGMFYYQGALPVSTRMQVILNDNENAIPIQLEVAKQADRVQDLGISSERNGISLTAIPVNTGEGRTKVSILPVYPSDSNIIKINGYGFEKFDYIDTKLENESKVPLTIERDEIFPYSNEFYYNSAADEPVRLTIPAINATKRFDSHFEIKLPVPERGTIELNQKFELFGYPVTIQKVESLEGRNGIRVYVDPNYDALSAESLMSFWPDFTIERRSGGASMKVNETTRAMEFLELDVEPGQKQITIAVNELQVQARGPWQFDFKPNFIDPTP